MWSYAGVVAVFSSVVVEPLVVVDVSWTEEVPILSVKPIRHFKRTETTDKASMSTVPCEWGFTLFANDIGTNISTK